MTLQQQLREAKSKRDRMEEAFGVTTEEFARVLDAQCRECERLQRLIDEGPTSAE